MFTDKRSKKVIVVAHCVLNQNSKIDRCAYYPGPIKEVINKLVEEGIGIIQLPCPEVYLLGLKRGLSEETENSIKEEDNRVAKEMIKLVNTTLFSNLVRQQVNQIEEYVRNGFDVKGMIGITGSPTCGVETNWSNNCELGGSGVYISALIQECENRGIQITAKGIKANDSVTAVDITTSIISQ